MRKSPRSSVRASPQGSRGFALARAPVQRGPPPGPSAPPTLSPGTQRPAPLPPPSVFWVLRSRGARGPPRLLAQPPAAGRPALPQRRAEGRAGRVGAGASEHRARGDRGRTRPAGRRALPPPPRPEREPP